MFVHCVRLVSIRQLPESREDIVLNTIIANPKGQSSKVGPNRYFQEFADVGI